MALRDVMADDVETLFFREEDFATEHTVNGITCMCVVDDDRLLERTDAAAVGTHLGEKLLFVQTALLPGKPVQGARLTLDGKTWYIKSITDNAGVYEIRLTANKT